MRQLRSSVVFCGRNIGPAASDASSKEAGSIWEFTLLDRVSYPSEKLRGESRWIKQQLAGGKDVFVYFNNDAHGYAVENAVELRGYVAGARS